MEKKTSDAQLKANKRYKEKNKEMTQYNNKKSACKNFILKTATESDLELVSEWYNQRTEKDIQL